MSDKWVMFKNYMHNELGITKEDIRMWISEAVREEAQKLVDHSYSKFSPETMIEDIVMKKQSLWSDEAFREDIRHTCARMLMEKFEVREK